MSALARLIPGIVLALAVVPLVGSGAAAQCFAIAEGRAPMIRAAFAAEEVLARLTWLNHSSFLIESAGGVRAVTDYHGYYGTGPVPDIVTMNNVHDMHFTTSPDPAIGHVLHGWDPAGGMASHDITQADMRVRNVPTNVRGGAGSTRYNGNSIFVFEIEDLCIAHLGHLHHELTPTHLAEIGRIDVLLVPTDGSYTMDHATAARVITQIAAPVVVPMHYFGGYLLESLASHLERAYRIVHHPGLTISLPFDTGGERVILVPTGQ